MLLRFFIAPFPQVDLSSLYNDSQADIRRWLSRIVLQTRNVRTNEYITQMYIF